MFVNVEGVGGIKSWDQSPALVDQLGERRNFLFGAFGPIQRRHKQPQKRISAHFEFF
jgi:hypothetical protein